jgi:uncharacterized protein (TIGR03790 family)
VTTRCPISPATGYNAPVRVVWAMLLLCACSGESDPAGTTSGASGGGGQGGAGGEGGAITPTVLVPKAALAPEDVGVLVNDQDPQSVAVANAYVALRAIPAANVVTLSFAPGATQMSAAEFAPLKAQLDVSFAQPIQALVLTWTLPYRVDCMSVTSAFALGFDTKYCNTSGDPCGTTAPVAYFDSASVAPWTDMAIRPTMMIAGETTADALALIDRGQAADDTFPSMQGTMIRTTDAARSVRWPSFVETAAGWNHPDNLQLDYIDNSAGAGLDYIENQRDVLFYFTGLTTVPELATNVYLPCWIRRASTAWWAVRRRKVRSTLCSMASWCSTTCAPPSPSARRAAPTTSSKHCDLRAAPQGMSTTQLSWPSLRRTALSTSASSSRPRIESRSLSASSSITK